jgi:hypothetical protein
MTDLAVPLAPAQMSRTGFRTIKRNIHFADNTNLPPQVWSNLTADGI